MADADFEALMVVSGQDDVILEEDDRVYEKGDSFKSKHYQACQPISRLALLASFFSIWLKKCVLFYLLQDGILLTVILLVI